MHAMVVNIGMALLVLVIALASQVHGNELRDQQYRRSRICSGFSGDEQKRCIEDIQDAEFERFDELAEEEFPALQDSVVTNTKRGACSRLTGSKKIRCLALLTDIGKRASDAARADDFKKLKVKRQACAGLKGRALRRCLAFSTHVGKKDADLDFLATI